MSKKLTQADVTAFAKFLVEFGNVYSVNGDNIICTEDGEAVCVKYGKGTKKLAVYSTEMKDPDALILNPFKETQKSNAREDAFFVDGLIAVITRIFRTIIKNVIDAPNSGQELPYNAAKYLAKPMGMIGKTSLNQFNKAFAGNMVSYLLNIEYDKKKHVAKVTTDLFDEEFRGKIKGVSKKNWELFEGLFVAILGTVDVEKEFTYKSTVMGMPKADAVWNVVYMLSNKLNSLSKALLDVDLHPKIMKKNLSQLEQVHQMARWLSQATVSAEEEIQLKSSKKKKKKKAGPMIPIAVKEVQEEVTKVADADDDVPWVRDPDTPKEYVKKPKIGSIEGESLKRTEVTAVGRGAVKVFGADGMEKPVEKSESTPKGPKVVFNDVPNGYQQIGGFVTNTGFQTIGGGGGFAPIGASRRW